jgi:hypothetical protein
MPRQGCPAVEDAPQVVADVANASEHRGGLVVDQPQVDPLREAYLELARVELFDGAAPEVPQRLREGVVVEKMEVLRVTVAAPHGVDRRHRTRTAFLLRHDAEPAPQPTAAREEADRRGEVRVERVVERDGLPLLGRQGRVDFRERRRDVDARPAPPYQPPLALDRRPLVS